MEFNWEAAIPKKMKKWNKMGNLDEYLSFQNMSLIKVTGRL